MIGILLSMYLQLQVGCGIDQTCIDCIDTYCPVECDGTSNECGYCIQRWCSYEC